MDEPDGGCSWQAWKFGMKRDDLYTKLQDQYNTVTLSIQDPDAFQHDVCEISKTAVDVDEFHRMLEERKEFRLNQLNESLQSASVEIIANPNLIGTDQWQHAIQLFRTRSFDSLVRYFASYLPDDHPWNTIPQDPSTKPFFDEVDDPTPMLTREPMFFISDTPNGLIPASHLPPSPRSLTMCSDSSSASTPARTLSFSEPESDDMTLSTTLIREYDDETSQWDDPDTPTTPISEMSDIAPLEYSMNNKHSNIPYHDTHEVSKTSASLSSEVIEDSAHESETPTPREVARDTYLSDEKSTTSLARTLTSMSPSSKYTPLERRLREGSPGSIRARRRSPEIGRIQKPSHDPIRARPKSLKS
ncbi:hypothetical protein F5B22DRAFT_638286 [Xylaria bambusicola]|uniref:uncharacterized protein n=1 Tax=Xylaria bambusicola TaxID=326684 RepID=UPI0020085537|nr:uncharacterized protein F5B22DRAFT_638286 [Xylaria bambusicola]KAI0509100.1 hypothetical protein F5B22DRAFT_638286 [Xylaria bambusicola]